MRSWILILCCFPPASAHASAPDLFGFGARGVAMAGTVTASASGHEAVYYNPAALAFSDYPTFTIGFQYASFDLKIDGDSIEVESAPATLIGFDIPLPLKGLLERRLALGFGFVLPHTAVLVADIPEPGTPHFVRFENRAQTVSIMGGIGVRIFDWASSARSECSERRRVDGLCPSGTHGLAIGAGFIALSELSGAIDVAPNDAGRIGARVRDELTADYAAIIGTSVHPWSTLSIGLVYRGASSAGFTLPITADLGDEFPIPIPLLDIAGTAQYDPEQLTLAGSYKPLDWLLVAFATTYQRWSKFDNPIAYAAVPDGYPAQPAPDFSDIVSVKIGAEASLLVEGFRLLPRAGVALEPSPVAEQTGFHSYLDNTRLLLTAGAGVRRYGLSLDIAGQLQLMPERTSNKTDLIEGLIRRHPTQLRYSGAIFGVVLELGVELK